MHRVEDGVITKGTEVNHLAAKESSSRLVSEIRQLIETFGATPDRIIVAKGPGSFTGVRIAVSTARNLSQLWSIPVCGIDTLTLYGWSVKQHDSITEPFALLIDGRQKRFYTKVIDNNIDNTYSNIIYDLDPGDFDIIDPNIRICYTDNPAELVLPADRIKIEIKSIRTFNFTAGMFLETAIQLGCLHTNTSWQELIPMYVRNNPAKPNRTGPEPSS